MDKKALSFKAAAKIAAKAASEARERGVGVVIAVVDDGGHLILLHRLDDTQVASVNVGIGKTRTAAIYRRPSKDFEEQLPGPGIGDTLRPVNRARTPPLSRSQRPRDTRASEDAGAILSALLIGTIRAQL